VCFGRLQELCFCSFLSWVLNFFSIQSPFDSIYVFRVYCYFGTWICESLCLLSFCFFRNLGIGPKDRLIRGDQSHRPLAGALFKARVFFLTLYGLAHRNWHQGESNFCLLSPCFGLLSADVYHEWFCIYVYMFMILFVLFLFCDWWGMRIVVTFRLSL
jgi:hypothetical protein